MTSQNDTTRAHDFVALLPLWLVVVLLPVGRTAEVPLLVAALAGVVVAWRERAALRAHPGLPVLLAAFAAYWLATLVSALDAVEPRKAWLETAADLRYLPFGLYALAVLDTPVRRARFAWLVAIVVAFWTLDALAQAAFGTSLGGRLEGDRVSGVFGDDNLKLGPVLAVFAPALLVEVLHRYGRRAALAAWIVLAAAILVAGARAAWVGFALATLVLVVRIARDRRQLAAFAAIVIGAGALLAVAGYALSERVAARVQRTTAALSGDGAASIDHALAFRLPIWRTALAMSAAHPVNGVGVRGFRHAYPRHAQPGDRWLDAANDTGAYHPHQIVLELLAETGAIGLLLWLAATAAFVAAWRRASRGARHAAFAPGLGLVAMTFPLNTHYAFYSSFWGLVLWFLVAWFAAALAARVESTAEAR